MCICMWALADAGSEHQHSTALKPWVSVGTGSAVQNWNIFILRGQRSPAGGRAFPEDLSSGRNAVAFFPYFGG